MLGEMAFDPEKYEEALDLARLDERTEVSYEALDELNLAIRFDPAKHPRDAFGRFIEVLDNLRADPSTSVAALPGGVKVETRGNGKFRIFGGREKVLTTDAAVAAKKALEQSAEKVPVVPDQPSKLNPVTWIRIGNRRMDMLKALEAGNYGEAIRAANDVEDMGGLVNPGEKQKINMLVPTLVSGVDIDPAKKHAHGYRDDGTSVLDAPADRAQEGRWFEGNHPVTGLRIKELPVDTDILLNGKRQTVIAGDQVVTPEGRVWSPDPNTIPSHVALADMYDIESIRAERGDDPDVNTPEAMEARKDMFKSWGWGVTEVASDQEISEREEDWMDFHAETDRQHRQLGNTEELGSETPAQDEVERFLNSDDYKSLSNSQKEDFFDLMWDEDEHFDYDDEFSPAHDPEEALKLVKQGVKYKEASSIGKVGVTGVDHMGPRDPGPLKVGDKSDEALADLRDHAIDKTVRDSAEREIARRNKAKALLSDRVDDLASISWTAKKPPEGIKLKKLEPIKSSSDSELTRYEVVDDNGTILGYIGSYQRTGTLRHISEGGGRVGGGKRWFVKMGSGRFEKNIARNHETKTRIDALQVLGKELQRNRDNAGMTGVSHYPSHEEEWLGGLVEMPDMARGKVVGVEGDNIIVERTKGHHRPDGTLYDTTKSTQSYHWEDLNLLRTGNEQRAVMENIREQGERDWLESRAKDMTFLSDVELQYLLHGDPKHGGYKPKELEHAIEARKQGRHLSPVSSSGTLKLRPKMRKWVESNGIDY